MRLPRLRLAMTLNGVVSYPVKGEGTAGFPLTLVLSRVGRGDLDCSLSLEGKELG